MPPAHRPHLGLEQLEQESVVDAILLMSGRTEAKRPIQAPMLELIASPFEFDKWDRLWRLNASLYDRPGLIADVTAILADAEIDILAADSMTVGEQGVHEVEILVVADEATVPSLEWMLLARLFDDVVIKQDGGPRIKFRRVHSLWRAKRIYDERTAIGDADNSAFRPVRNRLTVSAGPEQTDVRVRIPASMRRAINDTLDPRARPSSHLRGGYFLRASDTKDRCLRLLFFRESDPVVHARIEHNDRVGSLAEVTAALNLAGFDVICASSSPSHVAKNRARLDVVLRGLDSSRGNPTDELKTRLAEALQSASPDLATRVGFAGSSSEVWSYSDVEAVYDADDVVSIPTMSEVRTAFQARIGAIYQDLAKGAPSDDTLRRAGLAQFLTARDQALSGSTRSLFVSCAFEGDLLDVTCNAASEMGFMVVTGKHLEAFPSQIDGLLTNIGACSHFLGVWSSRPRLDGSSISPWLLWEFGVAHAAHTEWRLLIERDVPSESWQKIVPARQHTLFTTADFREKLDHVLSVLWELPNPAVSSDSLENRRYGADR